MRFFQLLLKVANHAALLAPTIKQTLDQQEKVGGSVQLNEIGVNLWPSNNFFGSFIKDLETFQAYFR